MILKAFITFFISILLIAFPQNIIGCGGGVDPYDYYTSFFHPNLPQANGYRPFYYTSYNFLYDSNEPADLNELISDEWSDYCGKKVTTADAKLFVTEFARKDVLNLYNNIEKNLKIAIPDSVLHNNMSEYFIATKDLEALGYLLYAKQVQPQVGGDGWEPVERDGVKMAKLIKNGEQLYAAAKMPAVKLRYAYQLVRLAHYSSMYEDAIKFYDNYVVTNNTKSILQPLSLSLKAGALYRLGKKKEAAYLFSKAFSNSAAKRVSNYLGFSWCINRDLPKNDYLAYCKTHEEKAVMLSMFAMGSIGNELPAIKEIYQLNANNEILEVLTVREINKLEEKYFTPMLQKEKGGNSFYYTWDNGKEDSLLINAKQECSALLSFLHEAAVNKKVKNAGLYETAAAYLAYIIKDYAAAKKALATAEKMTLTTKVKDQWTLTNILVTINEKEKIDGAFEEQLLPSLQWVEERVKNEKKVTYYDGYETGQWQKIYRDLMSEILARRYHRQGDFCKEALCVGAADKIVWPGSDNYYSNGISFMRNNLASKDVEKLYGLFMSGKRNKFENFLVNKNSITQSLVTDFAATAYLREYDYANAIKWLKKSSGKEQLAIHKNPFVDLLYDQEEQLATELNFTTNKLAFAETMQTLTQKASTDKGNAAKHYYKIANGMYNITYYGHTWELVDYSRSGSDGYNIPKDATAFQKEYYGCFSAHDFFKKAMDASTDKNFKGRCLFMMAKCKQKQVQKPGYSSFNYNYDAMEKAEKAYLPMFVNNQYFPQLVKEYGKTVFFEEAYNSCSYLRDYVNREK